MLIAHSSEAITKLPESKLVERSPTTIMSYGLPDQYGTESLMLSGALGSFKGLAQRGLASPVVFEDNNMHVVLNKSIRFEAVLSDFDMAYKQLFHDVLRNSLEVTPVSSGCVIRLAKPSLGFVKCAVIKKLNVYKHGACIPLSLLEITYLKGKQEYFHLPILEDMDKNQFNVLSAYLSRTSTGGFVSLAEEIESGKMFAMKSFALNSTQSVEDCTRDVKIWKRIEEFASTMSSDSPSKRSMFERGLACISRPLGIMTLGDVCGFLFVPYYRHGTLANNLNALKPSNLGNNKAFIRDILFALNTLHRCGICHLDISPDNIAIQETQTAFDGTPDDFSSGFGTGFRPVIIDFGASVFVDISVNENGSRRYKRIANLNRGKQVFKPIEMINKNKLIDPFHCDMWGLGGIFTYFLIGEKCVLDQNLHLQSVEVCKNGIDTSLMARGVHQAELSQCRDFLDVITVLFSEEPTQRQNPLRILTLLQSL